MEKIILLQKAIMELYGARSTHQNSVSVVESIDGENAWDGVVEVFDIHGNSMADRCFAWTCSNDLLPHEKRFIAILAISPIITPWDALKAASLGPKKKTTRQAPLENLSLRRGGMGEIFSQRAPAFADA